MRPMPPWMQLISSNFCHRVISAAVRVQQHRHRMPAVTFKQGRGGVIAGDHQHIGFQSEHLRYVAVHFLYGLYLGIKIAVFTARVGRLYMDEKEIIL